MLYATSVGGEKWLTYPLMRAPHSVGQRGRDAVRNAHLALVWQSVNMGDPLLGGVVMDPIASAVLRYSTHWHKPN